jgi:hypothetical protein
MDCCFNINGDDDDDDDGGNNSNGRIGFGFLTAVAVEAVTALVLNIVTPPVSPLSIPTEVLGVDDGGDDDEDDDDDDD